jgi:hypothetical protein
MQQEATLSVALGLQRLAGIFCVLPTSKRYQRVRRQGDSDHALWQHSIPRQWPCQANYSDGSIVPEARGLGGLRNGLARR